MERAEGSVVPPAADAIAGMALFARRRPDLTPGAFGVYRAAQARDDRKPVRSFFVPEINLVSHLMLYKVWAREIDGGYRLACEITDLLELRVSAPSRQAPPGCGRRCILAPAFPLDQPQLRRPVDERAAQPFHVRMPRAQLGIHSRDLLPAARDSRCLLAFPGDFRDDNLPLEHHRLPSPFRLPAELPCLCRRPE